MMIREVRREDRSRKGIKTDEWIARWIEIEFFSRKRTHLPWMTVELKRLIRKTT